MKNKMQYIFGELEIQKKTDILGEEENLLYNHGLTECIFLTHYNTMYVMQKLFLE